MKNLTIQEWVASQYEANLFTGCETYEDVESVIFQLWGLPFPKDEIIDVAWVYVQERL